MKIKKIKKIKEYRLHIILDDDSDQLEHFSEFIDTGENFTYSFDVDGKTIMVSKKIGEYMDEVTNSDILGMS